ncbi:helix-turn-helix transcriptional regulator [Streptacidiphilus neutrinimicus]|uniref:helix-turn-helix transcriptional regulator n=1 Tax=Streptacidiphilus neutrinimicus TaxID=105420 RepID=UPI0005A81D39|nr:helix-turn-helix domain-containing protein [Streptacidiphilus neutrinimicus]
MDHAPASTGWTFLTNHARVLVQIARDPGMRVRDIATHCLLTERAVMRIIADLERAGYLTHTREGRTNQYRLLPGTQLRHPADTGPSVADLLAVLTTPNGSAPGPAVQRDAGDAAGQ